MDAVPRYIAFLCPRVRRAHRTEDQIVSAAGDLRESGVVDLGRIGKRRLAGQVVHLVAVEPVVEDAEASAQRGLAVAADVVGKAEARRKSYGLLVVWFEPVAVGAEQLVAIGGVAGVRNKQPDV